MLIALFFERVGHTYFDPPEYLPLDFECGHMFIEAVQQRGEKILININIC